MSGDKSTQDRARGGAGRPDFAVANEQLGRIDAALADALENYVADVLANCSLDKREMELCVIASLVVQSHTDQLEFHFDAALGANAGLAEIFGVIVHCIPFSGWPKGTAAIGAFMSWVEKTGLTFETRTLTQVYGSRHPDFGRLGAEQGGRIYSDYPALERAVADHDEVLVRYVTEGVFGRFYGRRDLTLRLRQLTAVAILTSLGRLPQLESHIKGAKRVGCAGAEIRDVIKLMHLYAGWPATLNALAVLKNCL